MTKLIWQIEYPSYQQVRPSYLTSWRKSTIIHNHYAEIPKAFYQHGIAEETTNFYRFDWKNILYLVLQPLQPNVVIERRQNAWKSSK